MACYLVNSDSDGVNVVCTSSPEKYAWYDGIDREEMEEIAPGSLASSGHLACEEDASTRPSTANRCGSASEARAGRERLELRGRGNGSS